MIIAAICVTAFFAFVLGAVLSARNANIDSFSVRDVWSVGACFAASLVALLFQLVEVFAHA